jgi:hypothetical protein
VGAGAWPQRPWPWFAVSYYRGGRTQSGFAMFAGWAYIMHSSHFSYDLFAIDRESLVVMPVRKMLAHVGLRRADLLAQRAVHHLVVFVPSDVEMPWSLFVQVRVSATVVQVHFRVIFLHVTFEASMHRSCTDLTLSSTVSLASNSTGSPLGRRL